MTVDRGALKERAESISREHHSDVTCEMAEGVLSLLAEVRTAESLLAEGLKRYQELLDDYGEVLAERDRLKDALSHAYADARALWAVARDQLEAEVERLREALRVIINSAPDNEPERYDGESPALIRDNAMDLEAYWLAQIARRALEGEAK